MRLRAFNSSLQLSPLLAALLVAGTAYYFAGPIQTATGTGTALVGGPFTLTDQDGRKVTDKDFWANTCWCFRLYPIRPIFAHRIASDVGRP